MRRVYAAAALSALLLAAPWSGARAQDAPPTAGDAGALTFYHWLESPSETAALTALVDLFTAKYPKVALKAMVAPRRGSVGIFPVLEKRVRAGAPPDVFMMHVGYSAQFFLDEGLLSAVDDIWAVEGLEKVFPRAFHPMFKLQARYYAVPLNVHRNNLVWYKKSLLTKHGIDPATLTTWPAFFEAARKLRAAGVRYPIQLGAEWTASHVFECIVASLGISAYEDWVNGKMASKQEPRLVEALNIFKQYLDYSNEDHAGLEWDVALRRVIKGQAAFYMMGDWCNGEFQLAGLEYGKDYGTVPVPGTKGMYGITVDTFMRPRLKSTLNADRWLRLVASREGQDVFNLAKGSISARSDAKVEAYDAYQQSAIADFKAARSMYPSLSAAVPQAYKVRLDRTVTAFAKDLDVQAAAAALAVTAAEAKNRFTRVWSLQ